MSKTKARRTRKALILTEFEIAIQFRLILDLIKFHYFGVMLPGVHLNFFNILFQDSQAFNAMKIPVIRRSCI